jgi:acetate kinase
LYEAESYQAESYQAESYQASGFQPMVQAPARILVVNAGSSSLKLRLLGPDDALLASADAEPQADLPAALADFGRVDAVGHRVVHGGTTFTRPVLIDGAVETALARLTELAPLHQPPSLAGIAAVGAALPGVPSVACFDTAFHATLPAAAATYAVPADWRDRLGVRRYGFHGLSHAYAARRVAALLDRSPIGLRVVSCHLGSGASLAAVRDGRSVDTTMGFTPLEGLVMGTRSGTVDPGLVLWLQTSAGLSAAEVTEELEHASGLRGLAGVADLRQVLSARAAGDPRARLAFDVYLHRLRGLIAAMAAAMDGLDVLVFTGGVGEHAPLVRSGAADGLGFLGVRLDADANAAAEPDVEITAAGAPVRTFVITAREELEIAAGVRQVLSG